MIDTEDAGVSQRLTEFAAGLTYDALPPDVAAFVKLCILDQAGVQLRLSTLPVARIAFDYATSFGTGPSTIVGSTACAAPEFAAFANAVAGHAFELDDMHLPSLNHPGPLVVAPALAVGEARRASGRELIAAVACGYEVMGRIGRGMGRDWVYGRGYHPVGVLGPIGSAMAAAKTWRCAEDVTFNALGLATSHGGGTIEYNQSWGETTRLHAGLGAMGGIRSVALARAGLTGPRCPLAGKYGFARVHSDQCDFEMMTAGLGTQYILLHNFFKLRPYHGVLHAVIDKALEAIAGGPSVLREQPAASIRAIRVGLSAAMMRGLAEGHTELVSKGSSSTQMQFSLPLPLANAIVHGGSLDAVLAFDGRDPQVESLAQTVSAHFDEACEREWYRETSHRGARICVRVAIEMHDGQRVEAFGDPFATQRTERQLQDKFNALAGRVLPPARVDELSAALSGLEAMPDVSELGALMRAHAR
jgi:2-methylcitrate dehydratase PrpD